jgi:hypothetical protein
LRRALQELEHCQNQGRIKDDKLKALEEIGQAVKELLAVERARIDTLKAMLADSAGVTRIDEERVVNYDKQLKSYELSIARFEAEVARLREERDRLRKGRTFWVAVAFVLGAIGGALVNGSR